MCKLYLWFWWCKKFNGKKRKTVKKAFSSRHISSLNDAGGDYENAFYGAKDIKMCFKISLILSDDLQSWMYSIAHVAAVAVI